MAIGPIKFPPVFTPTPTPTPAPTPTPPPTATPTPTPTPSPSPSPTPTPSPAPTPTAARRETEVQERPSYPADTLRDSIRQKPAASTGWNIVADGAASDAQATAADPGQTAAAIMKDALAAMLAQANVDRQGALTLLLR